MMPTNFISGIDVSNHQQTIDWSLTSRCGISFAMIKASESTNFTDGFFSKNWTAAKQYGLARGAYHFGRPSQTSGHAEANYFLSVVQDIQVGDSLVLDLEDDVVDPNADLAAYCIDFLTTVEQRVGFKPLLYSRTNYLTSHKCINNAQLGEYGLWLAAYQRTLPSLPGGWPFWALWQYTSAGILPGITGQVDMNLYNGDVASLKRYGKL